MNAVPWIGPFYLCSAPNESEGKLLSSVLPSGARQKSEHKTRLAFFIDTEVLGGTEKYLLDLMAGMKERGYEVSLLCHTFPVFEEAARRRLGSDLVILSRHFTSITRNRVLQAGLSLNRSLKNHLSFLKSPGMLLFYVNMIRSYGSIFHYLKTTKPHIFHVVSGGYPAGESGRAAVLAARRCGVPLRVMTFHNEAMPIPRGLGFIEKWIDRKVEYGLHGIIAASQASKKILVTRRYFRPEKISVISNGISVTQITTEKNILRRRLGVPLESRLIGTIGFLEFRKGHLFLLRAFAQIASRYPEAHLVIIALLIYLLLYRPQAARYLLT